MSGRRCVAAGCDRPGTWQMTIVATGKRVWICDEHYGRRDSMEKPSSRNVPSTSAPTRRRGVMNETERAWADELEADAAVVRFDYEEVTITIGAGENGKRRQRYTPDFFVVRNAVVGVVVEFHEVKGQHRYRKHGIDRLKAAAKQYPEFRWFLVEKAEDGSWRKVPIE